MSQQKPKQPFLKRGTRQFLSNAQTRSQSQKPRIVQFTNEDDNHQFQNKHNNQYSNKASHKEKDREQVKIKVSVNVGAKNKSLDKKAVPVEKKLQKSIKNSQNQYEQDMGRVPQKHKIQVQEYSVKSIIQKDSEKRKPTLLSDYLSNQKPPKKPSNSTIHTNFNQTQNTKNNPVSIHVQSKAHTLLRQSQDDLQDDQQNQFIMSQANNVNAKQTSKNLSFNVNTKQKQTYSNLLLRQIAKQKEQKQNQLNRFNQKVFGGSKQQNMSNNDQGFNQIDDQINSDSQQDMSKAKGKLNLNKRNQKLKQTKSHKITAHYDQKEYASDQNQQNQKVVEKINNNQPSKLTQKLWRKGGNANQDNSQQSLNKKIIQQPKKMAIDDIPKDLQQQIVQKYFAQQKKQTQKLKFKMVDQMKIIQKKQEQVREQQKLLQRKTKQFQKIMEQKSKQYQTKLKSEQNKINRQKMYLKDHQTNKPDWKTKNQIQILKGQLNEQKEDKKKLQTKLRGEIDRLKTKLQKQEERNKSLTQNIRIIQLNELQQKKKNKEEQIMQKKIKTIQKANYWSDAPAVSKLERLFDKDFSLIEFQEQFFHFANNEYYKYYETKGQGDQMVSQQTIKDRIQRKYSNGKIQIQSIQKYIKEVFPWNYTILQFLNGDIKQTILIKKEGLKQFKLQIYFDNRQEIVQFTIFPHRTIHYFIQRQQIQLNDQSLKFKEICIGNRLVKEYANGKEEIYQKNKDGKIYKAY